MNKTQFGVRLKELRAKKGLNQAELGIALAEFMGRPESFSVSAISAWESGRKLPSFSTMSALSDYFKVDIGYLRGLTSANELNIATTTYDFLEQKIMIEQNEIGKYDGYPIWIEFESVTSRNQWGIIDANTETIYCAGNKHLPFDAKGVKFFTLPLPNTIFRDNFGANPLTWTQMFNSNKPFWVEVVSKDEKIKAMYNGWYTKNETNTCIISQNSGLILPLQGYAVSWKAYVEPFRNI